MDEVLAKSLIEAKHYMKRVSIFYIYVSPCMSSSEISQVQLLILIRQKDLDNIIMYMFLELIISTCGTFSNSGLMD